MTQPEPIVMEPGRNSVRHEFAALARSRAGRRVVALALALSVLGVVVNVAYATGPQRESTNTAASINGAALFSLLLAIVGTSGVPLRDAFARTDPSPIDRRRVLGTKARAYALAGVALTLTQSALWAMIALPWLAAKGVPAPRSRTVVDFVERETIASARFAIAGVGLGALFGRRAVAIAVALISIVGDSLLESKVSVIRDYGPVGALHAFSDPTHPHHLSVAVGGLVTFAWALLLLALGSWASGRSGPLPSA